MQRLHDSAKLLYLDLPYSVDELKAATWDLIGANGLPSCYLRPIAYSGYGQLGVAARDNPVDVAIMSWPWGSYLGEEGMRDGIRVKVSSWQRVGPNVIPHAAKATGVYINSMLAVGEANRAGYDEAILLTAEGTIADGSGESIFLVKDGVIYTPDLSASILVGITRDTVIQIAQDLGHRVVEKPLIRTDLYLADEVFMVGTAAEVTPIREVDDHVIGRPGPVTVEIQQAYLDTVHGRSDRWSQWLEYAPAAKTQSVKQEVRPVPLSGPYIDARDEELVLDVLRSGRLSLGPMIDRFEEAFAAKVGAPYAAAVSSGTAGLHLLCVSAGIGPGDEVITSPYSFAASANCFIYEGGVPVFADVDARTLNLDPAAVEAAVTPRTKAIVAVDIYGYPCELDPLRAIAEKHGLALIQDSCEALGAEYKGAPHRLARSRRGVRVLSEQADHDRRGRNGHDALGRGVAAAALAAQPGPRRRGRLARARAPRVQLPHRRHQRRARPRPGREARRDPRAALRRREALRRAARRRSTASRSRAATTTTTRARGSSTSSSFPTTRPGSA